MEQKGKCKHGEFLLSDGCPQCIAEWNDVKSGGEEVSYLVKVRYYSETTGELSAREYTYYSADPLAVGDVVIVPVRDTTGKAKVSAVDVPETEIQAFKDKVKTIPAGSRVLATPNPFTGPDPNAWRTGEEEQREVRPFCMKEGDCHNLDGSYCGDGPIDCVFSERNQVKAAEEKAKTVVELVEEAGVNTDSLKVEVQDDGSIDFTVEEDAPDTTVQTVDIGYGIRALPGGDVVAVVKVGPGKDAVVVRLLNEVMRIKEYADKRVVQSQQDSKDAINDIKGMGDLKKAIEEKRQEYVGPLNAHVKAVNDDFKLLTGPLAEADKTTRGKVTAYNNEMQRRQREAEEINRAKEELARKEAALSQGEFTVDTTPIEVPRAPRLTRAEAATAGMVDNWKWEVVDFDAVPNEYKVIDTVMLNSIAKKYHDQKQVTGIRFYNEPTLRVSSR